MTKFILLFKQGGKGFCTLLQAAMILLALYVVGWTGWNFYYDIAMFLYDVGMSWRDTLRPVLPFLLLSIGIGIGIIYLEYRVAPLFEQVRKRVGKGFCTLLQVAMILLALYVVGWTYSLLMVALNVVFDGVAIVVGFALAGIVACGLLAPALLALDWGLKVLSRGGGKVRGLFD